LRADRPFFREAAAVLFDLEGVILDGSFARELQAEL
jgi:hypothetical protein